MDLVREAHLGFVNVLLLLTHSSLSKVWLQFPKDKKGDEFSTASSMIELVQQKHVWVMLD